MKFNARGGVSILELFLYFPSIIVAAIVCSRHGFGRSSGWIFTLILCLIRIIGACCQLTTYHDQSKGLLEATIILDSVGISPLLLATLGLLSRCADSINERGSTFLSALHFRVVQILIAVGLILSIAGGTSNSSTTPPYKVATESKIGILLYVIAFILLGFITFMTMLKISVAEAGEKKFVMAVIIAAPFIFVRLVYAALSVFTHSHTFNIITGSVVPLICMAVLEEFIVVVIYLVTGFKATIIPKAQRGPISTRPWKGGLNASAQTTTPGARQSQPSTRSNQPIRGLVGLAVAAAAARRPEQDLEGGRR